MKSQTCRSFFDIVVTYKLSWLVVVCILGITADQASKIWAQQVLAEPYRITEEETVNGEIKTISKQIFYPVKVVEVVPNFFNLIYKENPAAAFSLTRSIPAWFRKPMLITVSCWPLSALY